MTSDHEMIRRMLDTSRAKPADESAQPDTAEYDWNVPHHFHGAALGQIEARAAAAAEPTARRLSRELHDEIELESGQVVEQYGRDIKQEAGSRFFLALALEDGAECGFLAVTVAQGAEWVGRLLGGGGGAPQDERELSDLEVSLLNDLLTAAGTAFCEAFAAAGATPISPRGRLCKQVDQVIGDDSGEYCRLEYRPAGSQDQALLQIVLASEALDAPEQGVDADELRRRQEQHLREHVGGASVLAQADLGQASVTFRGIAALEVGDVLVLDKRMGEAVELRVGDKAICLGFVAASEGRYALQVSEVKFQRS